MIPPPKMGQRKELPVSVELAFQALARDQRSWNAHDALRIAVRLALADARDEALTKACEIVEAKRCEVLTRDVNQSRAFSEDFAEIQSSLRALKKGA